MSTYDATEITPSDLEFFEGCPICGDSQCLDKGDVAGGMNFLWCLSCGLFFMNPRPTDTFLGRFYASEYWRVTDAETGVVSRILRQFERSAVFLRLLSKMNLTFLEGKILELGSGLGGVVWSMGSILGLSPHANEPDVEAKKILKLLDVNLVSNEEIESREFFESFSIVVLSHVLEHQTNPKRFLERAIRLVSPGGVLLIEVPNGAVVRDGGIQHPVVFSRQSLAALLDRIGFQYRLKTHAGRGKVALPPQYLVGVIHKVPLAKKKMRNRPRVSILLSRIGRTWLPTMRTMFLFSALDKILGSRRRVADEKTVRKLRVQLIEKLFAKVTPSA